MPLTKKDKSDLARVISESVESAMGDHGKRCSIGLNPADAAELKDFARMWRAVKKKTVLTIVGMVVAGLCSALFYGMKQYFQK